MPLHQQSQYRTVGHGHGHDGRVVLGQDGVGADRPGQACRLPGVTDRQRQGALDRLRVVGRTAGLPPRYALLHPLTPQLADRLAGVASRPADRGAVQQRQQLLVHPAAEIALVVLTVARQRLQQQFQDDARLG